MARLRRPLQLLLLLLVASTIIIVQGKLEPRYQQCGILTFCIVHKSCFKNAVNEKGWTILTNRAKYPAGTSDPPDFEDSQCDRYITIKPDLGGIDAIVQILNRLKSTEKSQSVKFSFKNKGHYNQIYVICEKFPSSNQLDHIGLSLHDRNDAAGGDSGCTFKLRHTTVGSDIRKVLTDALGGKFEISSEDDEESPGIPKTYSLGNVDLTKIKMLCEGNQIAQIIDGKPYDVEQDKELTNRTHGHLVPKDTKFCHTANTKCRNVEDGAKVQCPAEYPMKHRKGLDPTAWTNVKDGLVCRKGYLTHAHDEHRRVEDEDGIKCSRKKCSTCSEPVFRHQKEVNYESPVFEAATEGDKCRSLKCPNLRYMIVNLRGVNATPIIHKKDTLECSASNGAMTDQNWDVEENTRGELVDALCTNDVYCTRMHPLVKATCKKGDEECFEPFIADQYTNSSSACPSNYTLQYIVHKSNNKVLLSEFYCKQDNGKWHARDKTGNLVKILDNSTLVCRKNEKDAIDSRKEEPFLGSTAFWVFLSGILLVVIAIIVVGGFFIVRSKQQKERKKKAMASVSQTYKEPNKHKKGKKNSDRKKKQVSVVNSVTGDTDSGPTSQSGGGSTAGSVPIAPPSRLFSPTKGFTKPDKGCAVLELATGESKNLRWTNHAGDGPPTQRQPDSNNYATSHSKQEDVQSAIKFAPDEQEALKKAGLDAKLKKKKKEKSRQKSIEYNLGYPKPAQHGDSKRAKNWMTSDVPNVEESKGVDDSSTMKP